MTSKRLSPGTVVLAKYRVLEHLGGGGMGDVYRAEHQLAGRTVALKLLRSEFADDVNLTRRFFQEAQAANKIRHPNIVDVMDAGFSDHGPYVVMECLEGMSLSGALARLGRLRQGTALAIVLPMLDALDAAHHLGIVHRDLKPENVFLAKSHGQHEVRVKLLDFGIAKVLDAPEITNSPRTNTGVIFGTPDYLSPEQATGDAVIDGRSDIFAVGIVLFELLTGKRPFQAQSVMATAYRIVNVPAPQVAAFGVEIAPHLQAALEVALAKDKGQRFGTAAAFADMLAPLAADGATRREALAELLAEALATPLRAPQPSVPPPQPGTSGELPPVRRADASALAPTERPPVEDAASLLAESVAAPMTASAAAREKRGQPIPLAIAPTLLSNVGITPRPAAAPARANPTSDATPISTSTPTPAVSPRIISSSLRAPNPTPARPADPPTSPRATRPSPTPRAPLETPGRLAERASGRVWSPRPLPRSVAGKCHTRGSLIRAVGRWIERAHGPARDTGTFALVPPDIAETYRTDGYNALVWYDLEILDVFMQAAAAAVMNGELSAWRTLARDNYEHELAAIFRPSPRTTDVASVLKRAPASFARLLDFGAFRVEGATGRVAVKIEGFEAASLSLRYVIVGTLEGMLRAAGHPDAPVSVVAGEASFARDFELEVGAG